MRTNRISKETIVKYLNQQLTTREIASLTNASPSYIGYLIDKYDIKDLMKYKKPTYKEDYFNKIDTKEKAYILGFLLGDGDLSDNQLGCSIQIQDREVFELIEKEIGCNICDTYKLDKKKKQFPHSRISIGNPQLIKNIKMLFGGFLKEDRHIPYISIKYELYMLQGFFDAEGCITWGRRKDRDRIWQKISFTSKFKMLEGIQKILIKHNISTSIKPKQNEACYVMEIASKSEVLKLLNIIYFDNNFIVLKRKYKNAKALRLELGEFGES